MTRTTPHPRAQPSRAQTLSGAAVLVVLAAIAAAMLYTQAHYDPAQWGRPPAAASGQAALLDNIAPQGLTPLGPAEVFAADEMWRKINGKAELYLAAGAKGLEARRYRPQGQDKGWLEVYAFRMTKPEGAFAVFSGQRRPGAEPAGVGPNSYFSGAAAFAALGPWYVEAIPSGRGQAWRAASLAALKAVAGQAGGQGQAGQGLALFPAQGRRDDSLTLIASDAFGVAGLDQVRLVDYARGGGQAQAWLSRRASADQAAKLAGDYAAFLAFAGAKEAQPPAGLPAGARLVEAMGQWELFWAAGSWLAGVKGADRAVVEQLAAELAAGLEDRP